MDSALDWLVSLPAIVLYPALAGVAALENFVPPFPADVTVAFVAFLAAQGQREITWVFLSAWIGNVAGALAVYELSRRHAATRLERMLAGDKTVERETRFRAMFSRFGIIALFAARFVPGVRAIVPVVAGALRIRPVVTVTMLTAASAIWYGLIIFAAYRIDAGWPVIREALEGNGLAVGVVAAALIAAWVVALVLIRRRQAP